MSVSRTRTIDDYTYYLDDTKKTEREANIMANLYRRRNGWKVRVLPCKAGYNIWINLN
jgi:stress response protein SCP2